LNNPLLSFYNRFTPSGLQYSIAIVLYNRSIPSGLGRQIQILEETMAGAYSQIYIQIVFAVQGWQNLLATEWRDEVFKYIAGIIKNTENSGKVSG